VAIALAAALLVPWLSYDWATGGTPASCAMLSQMGIMIIFALSYNMQMGRPGCSPRPRGLPGLGGYVTRTP